MRHLLAWLDDDGLSLDRQNQDAVINILEGAWGPYAGTARDYMREFVEVHCEHGVRDGEYCEDCSKAYKEARREAGYEET